MSFYDESHDLGSYISSLHGPLDSRFKKSDPVKSYNDKQKIKSSRKKFRASHGSASVLSIDKNESSSIKIAIDPEGYEDSKYSRIILISPEIAEEMAEYLLSLAKSQKQNRIEQEKRKVEMRKTMEEARQEVKAKKELEHSEDTSQSGL